MKNVSTYINNIKEHADFSIDNITVEHRSNNKKRDFLFVNKAQCMHIPNKPSKMIDMCKQLADLVNENIKDANHILVIGFAETATAIGNLVADYLNNCDFVMTTTREEIPLAEDVISFQEEHSHASSQKLLSYPYMNFDRFDYILFVEDEISTGKTIMNFINVFDKKIGNKRYGVASVCNWQNKEAQETFKNKAIDVFALITGELKDAEMKMDLNGIKVNSEPINTIKEWVVPECCKTALFTQERLGHKTNRDFSRTYEYVKRGLKLFHTENSTIRVVGTEECKYLAIKVGEYLESSGYNVICQSTTRSPIDIMEGGELYCKHNVISLYEHERKNYIYNLPNQNTCMTVIITDALMSEDEKNEFATVFKNPMMVVIPEM